MLSKNRNTRGGLLIALPPRTRQGRKIYPNRIRSFRLAPDHCRAKQLSPSQNPAPAKDNPMKYYKNIKMRREPSRATPQARSGIASRTACKTAPADPVEYDNFFTNHTPPPATPPRAPADGNRPRPRPGQADRQAPGGHGLGPARVKPGQHTPSLGFAALANSISTS